MSMMISLLEGVIVLGVIWVDGAFRFSTLGDLLEVSVTKGGSLSKSRLTI